MSSKQLIRLAGVLAVALVLWGVFAFARHARSDRAAGFAMPKIDTSAVDTIAFTKGNDSSVLVRQADGHWRVNGYPAATAMVNQVLRALDDTSNWSELAARRTSSHAAMGVTADSGRHVRVVARSGPGLDLIAGHATGGYVGVFVRLAKDSDVYALHGPLTQTFNHSLTDWRDKTIVNVVPDSVLRLEVRRGRRSYALIRSGKKWRLASGAAPDSATVGTLLTRFHPLSATDFADSAQLDSLHFARPTATVQIYTTGPKPRVSLRFDSTNSGVWARADTGKTVYLLDDWVLAEVAPQAKSLKASTPKPR